ncbi:hypothetical protein GOQ27_03455 [Clostridium sp. D2Q-11]|uniref:Lipoprotein n=1 Tax=Anaeromonas frigoriresistens TaxID=2683708 RepID=A0A942Z6E6_9FIRM|nr:hypothetical protein [Anaeromonas frigoriresistens]MBS4537502.1 hypothetical protein [Anaeromonas frigoriresistens]
MKKKITLLFIIGIFTIFITTGCLPGDGTYTSSDPAGFFWGIWHGWLAPISLIIGFIKDNIRIYEVNNTGWWYDLGFYIAIISGFGGISFFRKKDKN